MTRRVIVLLVLAGAGLTLLSSGRPWVSGQITDAVAAAGDLSATGSVAAPGVGALALVAAAGAVVLATAGRRPVQIAAVVLAAGGLAVVLLGGSVLTDPADVLRGARRAGERHDHQPGGRRAPHGLDPARHDRRRAGADRRAARPRAQCGLGRTLSAL